MTSNKPGLFFYPLGSRLLRLTYPPLRGTDIWLLQRWLNRVNLLQAAWPWQAVPEDGVLTSRVLAQLRQVCKLMAIWQPWEVGEFTYLVFGQQTAGHLLEEKVFGSRPLIVGDEGRDVWVLQNRLVVANRRLAMILGRPADGKYDSRTARAVRAFQRDSQYLYPELRATGQLFPESMLAIWDRTILGGRELSLGSRGLDVLALQDLLRGLGYPAQVNGVYDVPTAELIARWQRDHCLHVTGEFAAADYWRFGLERGY